MIETIFHITYSKEVMLFSLLAAFLLTAVAIKVLQDYLPHDLGRAFAINGQLSKGKPRGAGIIFVITFIIVSLIFVPIEKEYVIYCILLFAAMLTGYLDDRAETPWGELKKGILDFAIALMTAITFVNFNPEYVGFYWFGKFIEIPVIVYIILAIILIWVSINVTNCSDGVDGLSSNMSIITLLSIAMIFIKSGSVYANITLILVACLLGYLWFNVTPSKLLMGDAGSRAIGFFIAVLMMKSFHPFLYLLAGFMLIVDGGLGLIKVSLLRFLHIHILKNVRTPIHDYARKTLNWSDSQVVFKFTMIQIIASTIMMFWIL
ncbi:MAG TPA: phospho-N-acetylmuramoyl-pentapeptide-transferase [Candidatus Scybalomonas excrementigallinarum]|nr:phospho-N-acetylmuramoyl-pentapeptide-transferase [Candidatus Scybalomonas excrementigallinarum]